MALESRLVISAVDQTAAAFAEVEARIKQLQTSMASLNPAVGNVGRAAGSVAPAASAVASAPRPAPETPSAFGTLLGAASALTGITAMRGGFEEAVGQQHEKMRQRVAGMTKEQIAESEQLAYDLAKKYPSVAQSDIMHLARTGATVTGDFEEAKNLIEPMTRLRVIAQAARPHASAEETTEEMDKLLKSMEIAGVTTKPDLFREYIGGISKSLNAFGDQMRPSDYFEMMKYSRQAGSKLSERFLMTTMTTLGSEIGGAGIGTAVASFNRAMVGGHMEHQAAVEMAGLGLFGESDLMRLKTGEVKGVKRGSHVKDWRLAQSDPDLWIQNVLLPALAAHGISASDEVAAEVSKLFPNRTAGAFVGQVATQGQKLAKNSEMWRKAMADEAADMLSKQDLGAAMKGMGERVKNFIATQIPTNALATGAGGVGSLFSFLTPPPHPASFMDDLKTDLEGWKHLFKSIEVGAPQLGGKWHSARADSDRELGAGWRARYFADEAGADAARERSRGLSLSHLNEGGHATPAPPQEVNVHGDAKIEGNFTVGVTSEFIRIVEQAKSISTQVPLNPVAGGHTGRMDSDAAPTMHRIHGPH